MKRFWDKVDKTPGQGPQGDCWLWIASSNKAGYGHFWFEGSYKAAHRFGYELQIGEIPEGLFVLHTCDTPSCVRGSHLFVGTQLENVADMIHKGHKPISIAKESGQYPFAKLTSEKVKEIKGSSLTKAALGKIYGVDPSTISLIKSGKRWKDQ